MILPPKLKKGGVIGIFNSSHPITALAPKAVERATSFLNANGYRTIAGSLTGKRDGYRSGSAQERAKEFNTLLADGEIDCLMASIGGMVSNAMLPYLDYDAFQKSPKIVVGHSDISNLLLGIYAKTGVTVYYGPNFVTTFGQLPPFLDFPLRAFEEVAGSQSSFPYLCLKPPFYSDEIVDWENGPTVLTPVPNRLLTVRPGRASGRLIGGNLNAITGIWGSPYMPEIREGDLLFLEDTEKFAAHSERYFTLLKLCGVFDKIGGLILGKHRKFDSQGTGKSPVDILLEVLDGCREFPILADFDCCHTVPILTLPIGVPAELDADAQTVTLMEG